MAEAEALASGLWTRLRGVVTDLGLGLSGGPTTPSKNALAEYDPVSGEMFYLDWFSERELVMAVLHELVHAYLHRPSRTNLRPTADDWVEERLAHDVAGRVCDALGLDGYAEAAKARGAPEELFVPIDPNQRAIADTIFAFLESVMLDPRKAVWPVEP